MPRERELLPQVRGSCPPNLPDSPIGSNAAAEPLNQEFLAKSSPTRHGVTARVDLLLHELRGGARSGGPAR